MKSNKIFLINSLIDTKIRIIFVKHGMVVVKLLYSELPVTQNIDKASKYVYVQHKRLQGGFQKIII